MSLLSRPRGEVRATIWWAAITAITLAVSACGGDEAEETPPATEPSRPTEDQAGVTEFIAKETEFHIELSQRTFEPGTYTFVVRNEGEIIHALAVEGEGLRQDSAVIGGGESTELTVALEPGTFEVWCPVGSHRDQGMTTKITVNDPFSMSFNPWSVGGDPGLVMDAALG